ncbi:MAG: hypothetical protein ISR60_03705 [Anaerolineales bacterium]|nr:hypothetical protein [Anaerolineales bacterium]
MPTPKNLLIFALALLLIPFVSACGAAQSGPTEAEIAIAVALTQTAIALEAQPPTAEPSPTPEDALQPISEEACNTLSTAIGQTVGFLGEISQVPFEDEISHLSGTACEIKHEVSGVNFENPLNVFQLIDETLQTQGWQEDPQYMAIGFVGEIRGYRSGNGLCRLWVNGNATDNALCADHATMNTCWPTLTPEQRLINITLLCAQGNLPEFIAQTQPQESELLRVEFPTGATGTQLIGRLTPGGVDHYVLRAEAEQNLVLSVYPPGVVAVAVIGEDGTVLKSDLDNSTEWSGLLPLNQEYYIDVTSIVTIESEYTLDISIPPLEPTASTGEVSGVISYPDANIPQLHVVGYNLDSNLWYYLLTGANNTFYLLPGLPPGKYHIAAYAKDGLNGFYMPGGAMVIVIVNAGETTEGIDLSQWFAAGSGPYPNDPVGW